MTLNEHVLVDSAANPYVDHFYPAEGYVLWRDNEAGNLDEDGAPKVYYRHYYCQKRFSEKQAPHIHAKPVDDTMTVC